MYSYVSMTQITTQANVETEAALIELLDIGNYDQVKDILLLSLCSNRDYLEDQSSTLLWPDKEMSDRFIESTSHHCMAAS